MGERFMSIVQRILFSGKVALFVCLSGLAGAFFGAYPAAAHPSPEGTRSSDTHLDNMPTAEDVDRMDEGSMRKFMEHLKIHLRVKFREGRQEPFNERDEDWRKKDDDFYLIRILGLSEKSILHHEKYPQAQSATLPALNNIIDEVGESEDVECEQGEGGNYFCAVLLSVEGRDPTSEDHLIVSGFDHGEDDLDFSHLRCPYVTPGSGADKDKVAADEVTNEDTPENREKLKDYVIGMEKHLSRELTAGGSSAVTRLRPCWRIWPWKYGSIYAFVIRENPREGSLNVVFNGNNPEFEDYEGLGLRVKDEDGVDIGKLISDEVGDPDADGFIEYKWDDPQNPDDDVDPGDRDEDGFRKAPGTSPKISYVKRIESFSGLIIASGFYPHADPHAESGDGDGCAVSGKSSTPSGAAFNLFLMVSVLLAGVWFFNGGKVRERM
jgi:hypothetical protein